MWITKLQLKHKDCPIVNRCIKFGVIILSYPTNWYERNGVKFATTTCYFQTSDETKKAGFIDDLKSDKRVTKLEASGDIFSYEINLGKRGEHVMLYYNKQIFFVKPTVNSTDGHEYWEVASWDQKSLKHFIKTLGSRMDFCKVLKFEKSDLTDIYFPNVMPKLTKNQKKAIELAYSKGYYSYPRKITLEGLAKISKVGISTYQEHLRKAELKLLPAIIEYQTKQG